MDYIIEKLPYPEEAVAEPAFYNIKYKKEIEDVDGNRVTIFGDTEQVTLEGLEAQLVDYQKRITDLQGKIDKIQELENFSN